MVTTVVLTFFAVAIKTASGESATVILREILIHQQQYYFSKSV
jgi:hypothetical protein